jgi:hypothetical protein
LLFGFFVWFAMGDCKKRKQICLIDRVEKLKSQPVGVKGNLFASARKWCTGAPSLSRRRQGNGQNDEGGCKVQKAVP